MKKSVSILLILTMVFAFVPGVSAAAWGSWGGWDSWGGSGSYDSWGSYDDWGSYDPYGSGGYSVTASTPLYSASSAQLNNIYIAAGQLASIDVYYGQMFSFNETVGPRTAEYGYKSAVNGRGAKVRGGGVGQVATTLYQAVRQISGITYYELETWNERFALDYVDSGYDAVVVDYANNKDFTFLNYAGNLHIEMWTSYSELFCSITVGSNGSQSGNMIGYASIPFSGTSTLKNNIRLAVNRIDGTLVPYYNEFSFNQTVGPRTESYGYGSAINGRGVYVVGGGVAQVASVLYLSLKDLNCIQFTEKTTYGSKYNQSYVSSASDAIVTDYKAGTDFAFRYTGYKTLLINMYINSDNTRLICEIYER